VSYFTLPPETGLSMEQIFFSRAPGSDWVCMTLSWREMDSNPRSRSHAT